MLLQCVITTYASNDHAEVAIAASGEIHVRRHDEGDMNVKDTGRTSMESLTTEQVAIGFGGDVMHVRRHEVGSLEVQDAGHSSMGSLISQKVVVGAGGEAMNVRRHEEDDMGVQATVHTSMASVVTEEAKATNTAEREFKHMLATNALTDAVTKAQDKKKAEKEQECSATRKPWFCA